MRDGADRAGRDHADTARASWTGLRRALGLAWRSGRPQLICFGFITIMEATVPVAVAWLTKFALDAVVDPKLGTSVLVLAGAALAGTGVLAVILGQSAHYLRSDLDRRIGLVAQDELFAATERFIGLVRFEQPQFLDRLSLAQGAGGRAPGQVVFAAFGIGAALVTLLGFVGSVLTVNPLLALGVLLAAIPTVIAEHRLSRQHSTMMWRLGPVERREMFFQQLLLSTQAAKELRLFGALEYFRRRMLGLRQRANREERRMDRRVLVAQSRLSMLGAVVSGASLLWALLSAGRGEISVGAVSLLVGALTGIQSGTGKLIRDIMRAHQQLTVFDHFLRVLDSPPDLEVRAPAYPMPVLRRGIEFSHVWFRYSPEHPWALQDVSFTIPFGRAIGLVGRNGAGKTTIIKLLCRLYDPEHGTIRWDGVDLRELDPTELRRRISAVFQDFMQYDLTAAENIAVGDLERYADREAIMSAAGRAGIHDRLINLPRGYDTQLTRTFFSASEATDEDPENGVLLSGGQSQRLALARALLRDRCDLMILDEPSSGLDAAAEHEMHQMLRRYRHGRTSVLISHRLGALREADQLIVLDQGRIVEQGNHHQLLAFDGIYATLFRMQADGYQDDPQVMS